MDLTLVFFFAQDHLRRNVSSQEIIRNSPHQKRLLDLTKKAFKCTKNSWVHKDLQDDIFAILPLNDATKDLK